MEKLQEALEKKFPAIDFRTEKHLCSDGLFDSLSIIEVIDILSDSFNVNVTMEYMDPMNFESVETIWNLMEQLS